MEEEKEKWSSTICQGEKMDDDARLRDIHYDPARVYSFGSVKALAEASGVPIPRTKLWLSQQMIYTT